MQKRVQSNSKGRCFPHDEDTLAPPTTENEGTRDQERRRNQGRAAGEGGADREGESQRANMIERYSLGFLVFNQ